MAEELVRFDEAAFCSSDGETVAFVVVVFDDGTSWAWCQRCFRVHRITETGGLCPLVG